MKQTERVTTRVVNFAEFETDIVHIRHTVFVEEQGIPESLEWDDHEHSSWHCLAHCEDQLAGTGRLQPDGKITRIAVLKNYRHKGVASAIVEQLLQTAAENHLQQLYLNAQTTAVALYQRYGFREHGGIFDEGGIDHVRMVRQWR